MDSHYKDRAERSAYDLLYVAHTFLAALGGLGLLIRGSPADIMHDLPGGSARYTYPLLQSVKLHPRNKMTVNQTAHLAGSADGTLLQPHTLIKVEFDILQPSARMQISTCSFQRLAKHLLEAPSSLTVSCCVSKEQFAL
ncbi:hypothetical protein ANO14919_059580 [Xylariales sp. No.14919]|nr:hypothetical protein ANO14919_059580 [Xylariales sp. No.14919]